MAHFLFVSKKPSCYRKWSFIQENCYNYWFPQILGPLLFLIYANDLPASFSAEVILFADDTTILANEMSHLLVSSDIQSNLDKISSHSSKNRLAPHPGKKKFCYLVNAVKQSVQKTVHY